MHHTRPVEAVDITHVTVPDGLCRCVRERHSLHGGGGKKQPLMIQLRVAFNTFILLSGSAASRAVVIRASPFELNPEREDGVNGHSRAERRCQARETQAAFLEYLAASARVCLHQRQPMKTYVRLDLSFTESSPS